MAVNGYIKGLQYYFVSTPYDKRKVAGIFCEKFGATVEEWEDVLTIGNLYIECNLVQDKSEASWGDVMYKTHTFLYDYAAVIVQYEYTDTYGEVNTTKRSHIYSKDNPIFAEYWAPAACRDNAPIYVFPDLPFNTWNIEILPIKVQGMYPATGSPIKSFPGWGVYPDDKEYNNLDEQVDVALEQQGKGLIASFVRYVKSKIGGFFKLISDDSFQTLGSNNATIDNRGTIRIGYDNDNTHGNVWTELKKEGFWQYVTSNSGDSIIQNRIITTNVDKTTCAVMIYPDRYKIGFDKDPAQYGIVISGKKETDLLTAQGGVLDSTTLAKKTDYASTTEYGVVKMAGKVDALADGATTAEVADRLNTLIAYLKSAGLMSEN